ncbi:hypothetical protein DFJ74DRAFT_655327 [Hyaloraphidium curvatum]|nr:hypothetical protein DFJ74DRAFT_655327 [Hyaloraphidium curvatum]
MVAGLIAGAAKAVLGGGGGGGPSAAPTSVSTATLIHNYVYDVGKATVEARVANEGAVTGQQDAALSNREAADVAGSQHGSVIGMQSQAADFSQAAPFEASLATTAINMAHGSHAIADAQAKAQQALHEAPRSEASRAPARADGVLGAADEEAIAGLFTVVKDLSNRVTALEGELRTKDGLIMTLMEELSKLKEQNQKVQQMEAHFGQVFTLDSSGQLKVRADLVKAHQIEVDLVKAHRIEVERVNAHLVKARQIEVDSVEAHRIKVDEVKAHRLQLGNFTLRPSRVNPTEHLEISQVRPAMGDFTEYPIALFGGLLPGMPKLMLYLNGRIAGSDSTLSFFEVAANGNTRVVLKPREKTPPNHEVGGVTF